MIPVKVEHLFLSNMGFVVLLRSEQDKRSLPIFIGGPEARAIQVRLGHIQDPRPMTHDLLKAMLDCMEWRLHKVEIHKLEDGVFFANLALERGAQHVNMDARPSDAIALALRAGAPVFVAAAVMDEAGRVFTNEELGLTEEESAPPAPAAAAEKKAAAPNPLQALEARLKEAVRDELYEDAARIRDEIKRLKDTHNDAHADN